MKRPMTTEEFFNTISYILEEQGKLPDILDYGLATHKSIPLKTCEFNLKNNLDYGGSEGIYLDLWIEYFEGDERSMHDLGTFKTLEDDGNAMHTMANLLADFILETYSYVSRNRDDFTWTGADVYIFGEDGKKLDWGYSCGCMENALKRKDELLKKYPQVAVRDNATRKEKVFQQEAGGKKGGNRKCTG